MGWHNPPMSWSELERRLSDTARPADSTVDRPPGADGGDAPAWSRKRNPVRPASPADPPADTGRSTPYAELHVHSSFSFLDGASSPEELVAEAVRLGLSGLAITDHNGFYGAVRLAEAAEQHPGLLTVFGAELSLELSTPQNGIPDPEGPHLLALARGQSGYHRLAGAITDAHMAERAEKGKPVYSLAALAEHAAGEWTILSGCRKGAVRRALATSTGGSGDDAAAEELLRLMDLFGRDNVVVELFDHGIPTAGRDNLRLAEVANRLGLPVIASNNVHFATPQQHHLASAVAAVRARRSLDELDGWLPPAGTAHLRSGAELAALFSLFPGAVERTVELAAELAFPLKAAQPRLPRQTTPDGHTSMDWLRILVAQGVETRYPQALGPHGDTSILDRLDKELAVIEKKDFAGYFLIVHDIVRFARERGILCQGRGSAANSAVCFALGITAVDSIFYDLPFERFLSSIRDEEPDIDVDFDSDRREEVIQYVYSRYGRRNAAQVANVISYRPKFAVRDIAKALGHSQGQQDAWSKQMERWGGDIVSADGQNIPEAVVTLATELLGSPRHLGIHSGGMVLTDRPVGEVCPIEHARKENRTVLQWDKDDCEWMGLVKFDLLGLGMLAALSYVFELVEDSFGESWTLDTLPKEEAAVYDMLCRADTIGVFQVESRAQMGTLPRLQPRCFYDLVIEVALIRPGPIQGGAVHPYIRRRTGAEPVTYLHPDLEPVLKRTLGIPLFQEQLMQMAMAVGGCSAEDADLLRRAMGSKRGKERISSLKEKLFAGMAAKGISAGDADIIYAKIEAFANFGFAESHSLSFALLVYASSWLKLHFPAAFLAALLRAQPMGFYAPHTLVNDARRHGVEVRHADIRLSGVHAGLEPLRDDGGDGGGGATLPVTGTASCACKDQDPVGLFDGSAADVSADHRRDGAVAVRLGLAAVATIGVKLADAIVTERDQNGDYLDMSDLVRRVGLTTPQLEALAAAGAFDAFDIDRRSALWNAGKAAQESGNQLAGTAIVVQPPLLPMLSPFETTVYDLWATGLSTDDHPMRHVRPSLAGRTGPGGHPVTTVGETKTVERGRRLEVAGIVTHRQRPATAGGVTFLNLEDETGILNVIVGTGVWGRYRQVAREAPAMIVRGILERSDEGVTNLIADRLEALVIGAPTRSRDFQ